MKEVYVVFTDGKSATFKEAAEVVLTSDHTVLQVLQRGSTTVGIPLRNVQYWAMSPAESD